MFRPRWLTSALLTLLACGSLRSDDALYIQKLDLTPEQRNKIQQIHARFREQIEALKKKEMAEVEEILTPAQKAQVKEWRDRVADNPNAFRLSAKVPSRVKVGETTTLVIQLERGRNFKQMVNLSCGALFKGIKVEPTSVLLKTNDTSAELKLTVEKDVPPGKYRVPLRATTPMGTTAEATITFVVE
jgi:hypothetical protein